MPDADLILSSRRVVTPDGVRPAVVCVRAGTIRAIEPRGEPDPETIDVGDRVVMPGLVDTHVHVNEPGRTEWEGFKTASRAAAAGGVTTIVDMPLNCSPATTDVPALAAKAEVANGRCRVDYGFWGGVVPGNESALEPLLEAGVLGFKCFLVDSGIDDFPPVGEAELEPAMVRLAELDTLLLVHAESPAVIADVVGSAPVIPAARSDAAGEASGSDSRRYARYLASRPARAEVEAVEMMARLAARTGCRVHIVHLSAAEALAPIAEARARGVPITAETCPHYLTFAAEGIADGATTFKCAPPIRDAANREALWCALAEGEIDLVASDHSPCPPELKGIEAGSFATAWGGISSLGLTLAAVWTGARARGRGLPELVDWLCVGPARLAGLQDRKGALAPGLDADLVVWSPDARFTVEADNRHCRHPLTPYDGLSLEGVVEATFVRGRIVYDRGGFATESAGRWLRPARVA